MNQQTVTLKNGTEEFSPLVAVVKLSTETLMMEKIGYFLELSDFVKGKTTSFTPNAAKYLLDLNLLASINDGKPTMHSSIKNILSVMIEGEGLEMKLVNPVAKPVT